MDYKKKYIYYKQKYLLLRHNQNGGSKKLCIIFYNKYNLRDRDYFPRVFLYSLLKQKFEENNYDIVLLKDDYPNQINKIRETRDIDLILNFEDYYIRFSRHFHSNMNLKNVYNYFINLEKEGINIYPPPKFHFYTNSKSYAIELYKNNEFVLPHSKTFILDSNKNWNDIRYHIKKLKELCDFSVIKLSFSADMIDIFYIRNNNKKFLNNFIDYDDFSKVEDLYNSYIDKDELDLVIIVQPFNDIVSKRENEYRMWYIDDKFVNYFCFGPVKDIKSGKIVRMINNVLYDDKNDIHKELLKLGNRLYEFMKAKIIEYVGYDFKILALRLDMSYAMEDIFIDDYSKDINNKKIRFYCNELENIDGTFYINIPIQHNNKKFDTKIFQNKLANTITKYLLQK